MGKKCCVPGCKSGYDSNKSESKNISSFFFPTDPYLRNEWISKIPRVDWQPTHNSTICSLHFKETDFQIYSQDLQVRRKESRLTEELLRKKLLPDAVPSIFSKFPTFNLKKELVSTDETSYEYQEMNVDDPLAPPEEHEALSGEMTLPTLTPKVIVVVTTTVATRPFVCSKQALSKMTCQIFLKCP